MADKCSPSCITTAWWGAALRRTIHSGKHERTATVSNEENPFYGITWEDISGEPTPLPEKNPTTNALDRFTTDSTMRNNEIPWTPWIRHSYHPGDRYAKLTIHRTPTERSKTDFEYEGELQHPVALMCFEHEYNDMPRMFNTEASWLTHRNEEH